MASEILTRLLNYWNNKPSSQIFARLGEELYKSGQRSRALEILREGIEKYPGYITGYIVLATCLFENDLIDEAEITARMANQLDPNNLVVLNLLADIAYRKRELETGLSYLDNILAIDP
ncbi:MAG: tetratricopeptide repeat protein, partial [bacterium]